MIPVMSKENRHGRIPILYYTRYQSRKKSPNNGGNVPCTRQYPWGPDGVGFSPPKRFLSSVAVPVGPVAALVQFQCLFPVTASCTLESIPYSRSCTLTCTCTLHTRIHITHYNCTLHIAHCHSELGRPWWRMTGWMSMAGKAVDGFGSASSPFLFLPFPPSPLPQPILPTPSWPCTRTLQWNSTRDPFDCFLPVPQPQKGRRLASSTPNPHGGNPR